MSHCRGSMRSLDSNHHFSSSFSLSLFFFSFARMPGECKASKRDHAGLLTTAAIYANTINI